MTMQDLPRSLTVPMSMRPYPRDDSLSVTEHPVRVFGWGAMSTVQSQINTTTYLLRTSNRLALYIHSATSKNDIYGVKYGVKYIDL